jgi:hypothetical protein
MRAQMGERRVQLGFVGIRLRDGQSASRVVHDPCGHR